MIVSKSGVIRQMDEAKELLAKVRILPVTDTISDKLRGFCIENVPSGSIIEKAGMKSGDIIYSIQGQRLESAQDVLQITNNMQDQSNIAVDLLRNGETVTLRYEVRD